MSIDIFRPGYCLDIDFLSEQIWLSIDNENPSRLKATEVYDILIKNPKGNPPLNEVWALFPNNCMKDGIPQIQSIRVNPDMSPEMAVYNWAYQGLPRYRENSDVVIWEVATDNPDTYGRDTEALDGKLLWINNDDISFPDIREVNPSKFVGIDDNVLEECKSILTSEKIQKTLVKIPFHGTPLSECERGWLRLIVNPICIDALPAKPRSFPGIPNEYYKDYIISYEQRLGVICPLVLRYTLNQRLDGIDLASETLKSFLKEIFLAGSSTRIYDHRISLIIPQEELDIYDTDCTPSIYFYGMIPIFDQKYMAFLWACGSCRNLEEDLVHNAMRIIDRVFKFGAVEEFKLRTELAPSGKNEAFSLLVNIMVGIGLLCKNDQYGCIDLSENTKTLIGDDLTVDNFNFNTLRKKYLCRDVGEQYKYLIRAFTDMHPYRIFMRLDWQVSCKAIKDLVGLVGNVSELNRDINNKSNFMRELFSRIKQFGME